MPEIYRWWGGENRIYLGFISFLPTVIFSVEVFGMCTWVHTCACACSHICVCTYAYVRAQVNVLCMYVEAGGVNLRCCSSGTFRLVFWGWVSQNNLGFTHLAWASQWVLGLFVSCFCLLTGSPEKRELQLRKGLLRQISLQSSLWGHFLN